jgi:hypothetical protein
MVDTGQEGPLQAQPLHRTAHPDAFGVPELKHVVLMAVVTVASLDGFYHRRCWRPDEHDAARPMVLPSWMEWNTPRSPSVRTITRIFTIQLPETPSFGVVAKA